MTSAADIFRALGGSKKGSGYMVPCPAHDDRNPSLSVDEKDGKLLLKCFAGCDQRDVVSALRDRGLWGEAARDVRPLRVEGYSLITHIYDYRDEDGDLVAQVCRYIPKDFRPRVPLPGGGFRLGAKGARVVPYRLPELMASESVVLCEGEKDADALAALGVCATTRPGYAGKWPEGFEQYFAGKHVFVVPDNDSAGRDKGEAAVAALYGVAASVRFCTVCADLGARADVSDWLEATGFDGVGVMAALDAFAVADAPDVLDEANVFDTFGFSDIEASFASDDFVEDLLIAGQMSVVYGPSNSGKTFFATDLAAHVALGRTWRDRDVSQGGCLYIAAEGAWGIKNRLVAFRQHYDVAGDVPFAVLPQAVNMFDSVEDLDRLINTVRVLARDMGGLRLIVLDTLSRVAAGADENSAKDASIVVASADKLRALTGAHVMLIHHTGKDSARGARGSSVWRASCDTEIEIEAGEGMSVARVTKQRELEIGGEFGFGLDVVELGRNGRGKPVSSCVVAVRDASAADAPSRPPRPRGAAQRQVFKALRNALVDEGEARLFDGNLVVRGVPYDVWRDHSFRLLSGEQKHKWTAFKRASESLIGDEFVGFLDDFAWVVQRD
jgi:hypothetical protein